ncbi:hypothetical protein [Tahibacter aquaticus]|nr:hypothetical protein [Tahibacter aquaticus]
MRTLFAAFDSRYTSFWYNFGWSRWVAYIDGWIPRFSLFVPIVGYLIIFSDQVGGSLHFNNLAGPVHDFGLTGQERLRFVYFGLFFLGVSNFIYRIKRPYVFRFGTDRVSYGRTALESFTYHDFLSLHHEIRSKNHYTLDGKYYDSEWDGFRDAATNPGEGTDLVERTGHWEEAKSKYGSLLRSVLSETFFRSNLQRRSWLVLCSILSTVGYLLLAAPSFDLFVKVFLSTFKLPLQLGAG